MPRGQPAGGSGRGVTARHQAVPPTPRDHRFHGSWIPDQGHQAPSHGRARRQSSSAELVEVRRCALPKTSTALALSGAEDYIFNRDSV